MLPKRKPNRLKDYDYSQNGAYFITVCTQNRQNLFWNVGASNARPPSERLSKLGELTEQAIRNIPLYYEDVSVEHYVIMPNHIHILLLIQNESGRAMHAPTVSTIIQQLKGYLSKQVQKPIWQKSFHDRIIRSQTEFLQFWEYIDTNPLKWELDCFYNV